jgi:hypothetical protein
MTMKRYAPNGNDLYFVSSDANGKLKSEFRDRLIANGQPARVSLAIDTNINCVVQHGRPNQIHAWADMQRQSHGNLFPRNLVIVDVEVNSETIPTINKMINDDVSAILQATNIGRC